MMKKIKMYQVDAFADRLFTGNPAAVCLLDSWIPAALMQSVAAENNLAETAFVVPKGDRFEIRWFTPTIEVDLCGHATLASGFILLNGICADRQEVIFDSLHSGELKVFKLENAYFLDFPADTLTASGEKSLLADCIGKLPLEVWKGKSDYMAVIGSEAMLKDLRVDLAAIAKLPARGLIVTARGDTVDFVSRFFGPQSGVDEDPVTGSAHTTLIQYWSGVLGKDRMHARQLSKRGGDLVCRKNGDRCMIGGMAQLYLEGEISIEI